MKFMMRKFNKQGELLPIGILDLTDGAMSFMSDDDEVRELLARVQRDGAVGQRRLERGADGSRMLLSVPIRIDQDQFQQTLDDELRRHGVVIDESRPVREGPGMGSRRGAGTTEKSSPE